MYDTDDPCSTWIKSGPTYALLDRVPRWRNMLRTAWADILRKPVIRLSVVVEVTVPLYKWKTQIFRSWPGVVKRCLQFQRQS